MAKTLKELREMVERGEIEPQVPGVAPTPEEPTDLPPGVQAAADEYLDQQTRRRPNGFLASEEVPDTRYDLNPYVDAKGEIPEPSNARWSKYRKRVARIATEQSELFGIIRKAGDKGLQDNPNLIEHIEEVTDQMTKDQREALADVCNGHPTAAQLNKMPDHVFQSFQSWVQGLFGPKA